jgi:hypothetical protein
MGELTEIIKQTDLQEKIEAAVFLRDLAQAIRRYRGTDLQKSPTRNLASNHASSPSNLKQRGILILPYSVSAERVNHRFPRSPANGTLTSRDRPVKQSAICAIAVTAFAPIQGRCKNHPFLAPK